MDDGFLLLDDESMRGSFSDTATGTPEHVQSPNQELQQQLNFESEFAIPEGSPEVPLALQGDDEGTGSSEEEEEGEQDDLTTPDGMRQAFLRASRGISLQAKARLWSFMVRAYPHMAQLHEKGELRQSFATIRRAQDKLCPPVEVTVAYESADSTETYRLSGKVMQRPRRPTDKRLWERAMVKVWQIY